MLTSRQLFKAAFLARCVEHGVTNPQQMVQIVKEASEKVAFLDTLGKGLLVTVPGKVMDAARDVGRVGLQWGIPLALAAPPVLGGVAGYSLAKATDIDDTDVEEAKRQELIDELRQRTTQLRSIG